MSCCTCPSLNFRHVHCPCELCEGRAVCRATEYRHWAAATESSSARQRFEIDYRERSPTLAPQVELAHTNSTDRDYDQSQVATTTSTSSSAAVELLQTDHRPTDASASATTCSPDPPTGPGSSSSITANSPDPKDDVVWSVMEVMQLVDETNASEQKFADLLHLSKESYRRGIESQSTGSINISEYLDGMQWPDTYREAMKLIEDVGYRSPKKMHVCLSNSHPWLWDVTGPEEECRHCGKKGEIPYYYLSLYDKVYLRHNNVTFIIAIILQIRRWCSCESFCEKITAHWRQKDHWFNKPEGHFPRKEIWDGTRFAELSWYFDPAKEWMLPVRCSQCRSIIPATKISLQMQNQAPQNSQVSHANF